jgi:hypothetical protein
VSNVNGGRTNVQDDERSGRPSLVAGDLKITTNRHSTLDEIHEKFPHISRSLMHDIVTEHLQYKQICKICATGTAPVV